MRFLCLHGMGTNSKVFEVQLAKLRLALGGDHDYFFVDGSTPTVPAPGLEAIASPGEEFLCYAKEGDLQGAIQLYNDMRDMVELEGPFDGVIGFSEGAAIAASMIVDDLRCRETGRQSPFAFSCGVFFCAGNPIDCADAQRGELRVLDQARDGRVITIPTAHIWASEDNVHAGFGQRLAGICKQELMETHVHDLGHTVPGAQSADGVFETARAIRRTVERAEERRGQ